MGTERSCIALLNFVVVVLSTHPYAVCCMFEHDAGRADGRTAATQVCSRRLAFHCLTERPEHAGSSEQAAGTAKASPPRRARRTPPAWRAQSRHSVTPRATLSRRAASVVASRQWRGGQVMLRPPAARGQHCHRHVRTFRLEAMLLRICCVRTTSIGRGKGAVTQ